MKCFLQHEPLLVQQVETNHWALPVHTQNYFELILIQAGSGSQMINGNRFAYQTGDVFLLGPADHHYVVIDKPTRFYSLTFTELFIRQLTATGLATWAGIEAYYRSVPQPLMSGITTNGSEQRNLLTLVEIILVEKQSPCPLFSNPVVESLMRTILSLLDRQLTQHLIAIGVLQTAPVRLIQRIITYVCRHITEPDLLRIEKMADVFNYSPSHLGALFKQHIGESIQQYVIRYKLKLVETRLSLSAMTISQIADEFGFSDVCHLNKLFKRYYHHTPTNYRRSLLR